MKSQEPPIFYCGKRNNKPQIGDGSLCIFWHFCLWYVPCRASISNSIARSAKRSLCEDTCTKRTGKRMCFFVNQNKTFAGANRSRTFACTQLFRIRVLWKESAIGRFLSWIAISIKTDSCTEIHKHLTDSTSKTYTFINHTWIIPNPSLMFRGLWASQAALDNSEVGELRFQDGLWYNVVPPR